MTVATTLPIPTLGLVCITRGPEVRYRTITRTRYLALPDVDARRVQLSSIYSDNIATLFGAIAFCAGRGIGLYRITSDLFPMADLGGEWEDGVGQSILDENASRLASFGAVCAASGVRAVLHPDQFVVLNSLSETVVANSIATLTYQADLFDRLGLSRSSWNAMNIHGGKGGRGAELVETITRLPESVRTRLTLENDEHVYGAGEILEICQKARVPMVFDIHHHTVREKLASLDNPSSAEYLALAATTWQPSSWQIVHVSNGREGIHDSRHADLVPDFPDLLRLAPFVEVEAKGKEEAIQDLQQRLRD